MTTASALPNWITCGYGWPNGDTCTSRRASCGPGFDDSTVRDLRKCGWRVVDGKWTCPNHAPKFRNPYCSNCGDTRGGAYGHEAHECTFQGPDLPPSESLLLPR